MINSALSLYSKKYLTNLAYLFQASDYKAGPYLKKYWHMQNFSRIDSSLLDRDTKSDQLVSALNLLTVAMLVVGAVFILLNIFGNITGGWEFGAAILVGYPVIIAHLLPLINGLIHLPSTPKRVGRAILCHILEGQVAKLRQLNKFKLIAVAGSVGKTSTKLAIAKTLSVNHRVIFQDGNYNDRVTVPLILFGQSEPSIFNVFAWAKIIMSNWLKLRDDYPYDLAVVEIGTDGPGKLQDFEYLQPDIFVLTAIAEEHMQYFKSLDAVAAEELEPMKFSKQTLINLDNVSVKYLPDQNYTSYGMHKKSQYMIVKRQPNGLLGQELSFKLPNSQKFSTEVQALGEQGASVVLSTVATADMVGLKPEEMIEGLKSVTPVPGRMQILAGKNDSTIIDDTYNASPTAAKAALDVLYSAKTSQRIAILGNMNELGTSSEAAHREIGEYCDAKKLDAVVTIGPDANKYLADTARQNGCKVKRFDSPYAAGKYVASKIKKGSVILAKGSQNGVFAEEALKSFLQNPEDQSKLVRQSDYWMKIKQLQFPAS